MSTQTASKILFLVPAVGRSKHFPTPFKERNTVLEYATFSLNLQKHSAM